MADTNVEGEVSETTDTSELDSAVDFFRREGLEVPENLVDELRGGPVEEGDGPTEFQAAEVEEEIPPGDPEPAQDSPQRRGWETRREGLKRAHETLQRQHQATVRETAEVREYADVMLQLLMEARQGKGPLAAGQQAPPPQEPQVEEMPPDWIEQPDEAFQHRIDKVLAPYKQAITALLKDKENSTANNKVKVLTDNLSRASAEFARQDPGYPARIQGFQAAFVDDLIADGFTEAEAQQRFFRHVNEITLESILRGKNPIPALNRRAMRYAGGVGAPPQQPAPQQNGAPRQPARAPNGAREAIDAAVAASVAGAARPSVPAGGTYDGGGPVTIAKLKNGSVRPGDVRQLLKEGGVDAFWKMAKQAEDAQI